MGQEMVKLKERRVIESVDLETKVKSNLDRERRVLESEFSKSEKENTSKTSMKRILEIASRGEIGLAKSLILEQLSWNTEKESLLETLAILETYELGNKGPFVWCDRLLEKNPQNPVGMELNATREGVIERDWLSASTMAQNILERDSDNWFALMVCSRSFAALGNWEKSTEYWNKFGKTKKLSMDERYESARASYNSKKFARVVEIIDGESGLQERSTRFLELLVRSNYNLGLDHNSINFSKDLLELDTENKVGLRHYSRSLIRLGNLSEAVPIIRKYCEVSPFSVDAWESLIETQLMMDKVEESSKEWKDLRVRIADSPEGFFTAAEVALRFHWREEYQSLIENEGLGHRTEPGFAENLATIFLNIGDIGGAWNVLSINGIDPIKSSLREKILEIIEGTNTEIEEILERVESGDSMWIAELVSREIRRKARNRREIGRNRKKCLLVSSSLDRGGAERQVAMTLKHMEGKREFDCSLAVHRMTNKSLKGTYLDELKGLEKKVFDLGEVDLESRDCPASEIISENSNLLGLLDSSISLKIKQLISHFSDHKPDLVHAWQDETILTSSIAASLTGVPVLLGSARSMRPDEKTELHIRKRPYLRNCFREIFSTNGRHLSTNSYAGKESYSEWIGLDPEMIIVNENGVDFEEIERRMDLPLVEEKLDEFGFSRENKIVGGLFRLEAGKRPELWIMAFNEAMKNDPNLRGVIVGGGRMENSVKEWLENAGLDDIVKIVGEVTDVGSWLSKMDVFLFTSVTEGLPNVLIEAQGFGVPVVSTNVGGVAEVISDGETGLLVDSSSAGDLGKSITKLIGSAEREKMREDAKNSTRERFSVHRMATRTGEMYSRVLAVHDSRNA